MPFTEEQIKTIAPNENAFAAGIKLSRGHWENTGKSNRGMWGSIKGSGKKPYMTQIDLGSVAYKCSCPSRQFPCKHALGLLLAESANLVDFSNTAEPDWVIEWLDKRTEKSTPKAPKKELTEDEKEKAEKSKDRTAANRLEGVLAGVTELELWLKDLLRMGLLELPNKPYREFAQVAKRMVDAKANGLANWVNALGGLNYLNPSWQDEAMAIIAKLNLLIQALKTIDKQTEDWQITLKNLAGYSQSSKELLANANAKTVTDNWLVVGQQVKENDDITIQRNWLVGTKTNERALILNFATKFSPFETPVVPGSVIAAELAFFPAVLPNRAIIKSNSELQKGLEDTPEFVETLQQAHQLKVSSLKLDPWANDHIVLLKNSRLICMDEAWCVLDNTNAVAPVISEFSLDKCLKWLAITGNDKVDMACVIRDKEILPLGVFNNLNYTII